MDFLIEVLTIFTLSNKFLLSFYLLTRKDVSKPIFLLSLIFLLPGFTVLGNYLLYIHAPFSGIFSFIHAVIINMMGPILYVYALMLLGENVQFKKLYWTTIPSIIGFVSIFLYIQLPESEKIVLIREGFGEQHPLMAVNNLVIAVSFLFFIVMGLVKIHKIEKEADDVLSNTYQIKLRFLKELFYLFLILGLIAMPATIVIGNIITDLIILPICVNLYTFYIFYQSYNNHVLFTKKDFEKYTENLVSLNTYRNEKYQNSKLSEEEASSIYNSISNILKTKNHGLILNLN